LVDYPIFSLPSSRARTIRKAGAPSLSSLDFGALSFVVTKCPYRFLFPSSCLLLFQRYKANTPLIRLKYCLLHSRGFTGRVTQFETFRRNPFFPPAPCCQADLAPPRRGTPAGLWCVLRVTSTGLFTRFMTSVDQWTRSFSSFQIHRFRLNSLGREIRVWSPAQNLFMPEGLPLLASVCS